MKLRNIQILLMATSLLLPAACETKRPPFEIDNTKYGELVNHDATTPGILIQKRAIRVFHQNYFVARNHKAMAQSSSGAWGWSENHRTLDRAMDAALVSCRERNRADEASKPCKLVIIDSYWGAEFYLKQ
jgi:hypothetical protein